MSRAFIGMGSNIDPERNLREAVRLLASLVRVLDLSTVYRTAPINRPDQSFYYNSVVAVETILEPKKLKQDVLRAVESRMGRVRTDDRFAPRTIDLDLLVYGDLVLHEPGLELPDPDILERPFLARGLCELVPDMVLPGTNTTIADIARRLEDPAMKPLASYTALLKGELNHGP